MPIAFKSFDPAGNAITTSSQTWVDIPDLSFSLMEYNSYYNALIILNLPQPYTVGTNWPTIFFAIALDSKILVSLAMSYNVKAPGAYGSMPSTLQTCVSLRNISEPALIHAQWHAGADGVPHINSYCSISAIIENQN